MRLLQPEPLSGWRGYVLAALVTAMSTGVSAIMSGRFSQANLVMVYLLGVSFVASRCVPRAAVLASFLAVGAFDFCFVHPTGTFVVADVQYLLTFLVMLIVSLLISTLTARLREQSKARADAALHAQIEKARGDLLSAVSHDLRTPLASIEGSAGALLYQKGISDQSRQLALTIQDQSIRMARMIRNLLDMTRVQGLVELDLDWYGLDELAANAILRTETLFDEPVQLQVGPQTVVARVDGVLMEQVFVNLLENAARHAGKDARVLIAMARSEDQARVTISDDGPGIEPGLEERIFERFRSSPGTGFGLGLPICRAGVEAHGGRIWAENRPEGGARFVIELPQAKESRIG